MVTNLWGCIMVCWDLNKLFLPSQRIFMLKLSLEARQWELMRLSLRQNCVRTGRKLAVVIMELNVNSLTVGRSSTLIQQLSPTTNINRRAAFNIIPKMCIFLTHFMLVLFLWESLHVHSWNEDSRGHSGRLLLLDTNVKLRVLSELSPVLAWSQSKKIGVFLDAH